MSDTEKELPSAASGEAADAAEQVQPDASSADAVVASDDAAGAPAGDAAEPKPEVATDGNDAAADASAAAAADAPEGETEAPAAPAPPAAEAEPQATPEPAPAEPAVEAAADGGEPAPAPAPAPEKAPDAAEDQQPAPSGDETAAAAPPAPAPAPDAADAADDESAASGAEDEPAEAAPKAGEGGAEEAAAAAGAGGEGEAEASHHPDVVTDITLSPEAHAELDEMAQQQAREVIRSRQGSTTGELATKPSDGKRRSSASNASVRSAASVTQQERQAPVESLANMAMQPPSPSKIKTGPWLTGTYRLPKSGKIISGEELCDALERMTNAYIDKYSRDKEGNTLKDLVPGAVTVFNSKKLSADEYDSMIARLYKPKDRNVQDADRIQLVTLKFGEDGQEHWAPVKTVSAEGQQAYMCQLYQRCLENRKKTQEELAAKYLKPLGQPRKK
ncbi:hypothetical protein Agub_g6941 [Astrephomene gubernaculifera]|uniref:Uncharacterized protein n=1 Tax=Astrephomene gubernaculifera TaxID=47775 RepID=A0AAD3HLW6_9CHLO|nr:hypothetical protein Agub_g6941 [Astrephomene gubernaculifera]